MMVPDRTDEHLNILRAGYILRPATELTIASGAITATKGLHTVDTESDGATDDLDTINGGLEGMLLILRPASGARTVVVKHNTGNILCSGGTDVSLAEATDHVLLIYTGAKWVVLSKATLA